MGLEGGEIDVELKMKFKSEVGRVKDESGVIRADVMDDLSWVESEAVLKVKQPWGWTPGVEVRIEVDQVESEDGVNYSQLKTETKMNQKL